MRMERMTILSGARVTRPTRVAMSTARGGGEKGGVVVVVGVGVMLHSTLPPISEVHVSDQKVFVISGSSVFVSEQIVFP